MIACFPALAARVQIPSAAAVFPLPERARRAVPQHGVGPRACAGGRVRRRAGAPAAQVRRMRPAARQRQPV